MDTLIQTFEAIRQWWRDLITIIEEPFFVFDRS